MDDPIDLSPLDPTADPARFERLLSAVVSDALTARATRPSLPPILLDLTRWTRPLLALAATIAVVAGTLLFSLRPPAPELLAESVGVPRAMAEWVERGEHPSAAALVAVFSEVRRNQATKEPR